MTSTTLIRFLKGSSLLAILFVSSVFGQTVVRIRLGHKDWTARLVGITGTGTQAQSIAGTYDAKYGYHEFLTSIEGGYELEIDRAGGTSYTEDTDWDAGQTNGKFIPGPEKVNLAVFSYGADDDAEIYFVNDSADTSYVWNENAAWDRNRAGMYIGSKEGQRNILTSATGYNGITEVHGTFNFRTFTTKDTTFTITPDTTNNRVVVMAKGLSYVAGSDTLASAAGPTLTPYNNFVITGTTNITSLVVGDFEDFAIGYFETSDGAGFTWTDGNNLKLAGNFISDADDILVLQRRGANFHELSRSAN